MNRVGMAIDVSHCGERTSREAIEASRHPVLVTHSNCRTLNPGHPRCKSDAVIRRMAASGGVMGITVVRAFVGGSRPSLDDLLGHYDHVARLVGVEHVGLGSDTDVTALDAKTGKVRSFYAIRGLDPATRTYQIADGLLRRGYSPEAVELVLGGNFRRALAAIWHTEPRSVDASRELRRDPFCPTPRPAPPG
jgi:membrane dipeptidase